MRGTLKQPAAPEAGSEAEPAAPRGPRHVPGIAPELVASQVRATAPWLLDREIELTAAADAAVSTLTHPEQARASWLGEARDPSHLRLLLCAHWATVATFCPTDVDGRIRHTEWQMRRDVEELEAACAVVSEVAALPVYCVSARVLDTPVVAGSPATTASG